MRPECDHHNCRSLSCLALQRHPNATQVSFFCLKKGKIAILIEIQGNFSRWELLQGSLLAGGVAAGPLVANPVRLKKKHHWLPIRIYLIVSCDLHVTYMLRAPVGAES